MPRDIGLPSLPLLPGAACYIDLRGVCDEALTLRLSTLGCCRASHLHAGSFVGNMPCIRCICTCLMHVLIHKVPNGFRRYLTAVTQHDILLMLSVSEPHAAYSCQHGCDTSELHASCSTRRRNALHYCSGSSGCRVLGSCAAASADSTCNKPLLSSMTKERDGQGSHYKLSAVTQHGKTEQRQLVAGRLQFVTEQI